MSDQFQDRIEALLREAKISPEEAERLRAAVNSTGEPQPLKVAPSTPVMQPEPAVPASPRQANPSAGEELLRVQIHSNAGNVTVQGVSGLAEPVVRSGEGVQLNRVGATITVSTNRRIDNPTELEWLDTVFKALGHIIPTDIVLDVPAALAILEVRAVAGNVRVRGVRGRVELESVAGNVDVRDAVEFQLKSIAGNVDVGALLRTGRNTVSVQAGNATVRLERGSSIRLDASSTVGNASARGLQVTRADKSMTGQTMEAKLGDGSSILEVRVTAGNATIIADVDAV